MSQVVIYDYVEDAEDNEKRLFGYLRLFHFWRP